MTIKRPSNYTHLQLASGEAAESASGTPKADGEEATDEDDPALVDARSIYIGNVSVLRL